MTGGFHTPESLTFAELREHHGLAAEIARLICERHHLPRECERIEEGSQIVFSSAGHHIVKIFSPDDADFFKTETVFLDRLHGRLPVRTPALVASGHWDAFPYIVMERLPGVMLRRVWDDLSREERRAVIARLGECIRALHALPCEWFDSAPFRWRPFIEQQRESLVERHRSFGLDEAWIALLPRYMEECRLDPLDESRLVPLHTELMQEHVLVERSGADWILSGLIDFEPSMVGHAEYEFCSAGLFLTRGDKDLFRLFLSSYGFSEKEAAGGLSRRVMAFLLLHRYGNLHRFLGLLPGRARFTTLHELEQHWYGV